MNITGDVGVEHRNLIEKMLCTPFESERCRFNLCSVQGKHGFYQYHPPFVTKESILKDMTALPPEKSMEDKYYLGFFAGDELVAVMDLILNYPKPDIAFIGFFMMNAQYQGRGIGSQIVDEVTAHLKACGFNEMRLGIDKGNPQSRAFWTKNGFSPVDEKGYILMSRMLPD